MKRNVRAVVVDIDSVALIRRVRNESEYWVFPGGSVEEGESDEEALVREVFEELGLVVEPLCFWASFEAIASKQHFYLCRRISGNIEDAAGPEHTSPEYAERGIYDPQFMPLSRVQSLNLVPEDAKRKLIEDVASGDLRRS